MNELLVTPRIGSDARTEHRRAWARRAIVTTAHGESHSAQTIEISATGLSVMTDSPLPVNVAYSINVTFLRGETIAQLNVKGNSVYCILVGTKGYRTGVQFTEVSSTARILINEVARPA